MIPQVMRLILTSQTKFRGNSNLQTSEQTQAPRPLQGKENTLNICNPRKSQKKNKK